MGLLHKEKECNYIHTYNKKKIREEIFHLRLLKDYIYKVYKG